MEQPKFFQQHAKPDASQSSSHVGKSIWKISIAMFVVLVVAYFGWQLFAFSKQFADNWKEVMFAAEKPNIVRSIRTQYEAKQTALDKQFTDPSQQTMQQQIRAAVSQALQATPTPAPSFR